MYRWPSVGSLDSDEEMDVVAPATVPRDVGRPVIPEGMRKLRHVEGVSLRNVNLRSERTTGEEKKKRRASIVRWQQLNEPAEPQHVVHDTNNTPLRTSRGRRSTVGQVEIERTLKDINADKLLDTAFTIYHGPDLLYASEVSERSMNPEFQEVDLTEVYCRNDNEFRIMIWGRSGQDGQWERIFIEGVKLDELTFLAQAEDCISGPFPKNTLIIHLADGCYVKGAGNATLSSMHNSNGEDDDDGTNSPFHVESCTYDTINKIKTLEECTNDNMLTIDSVEESIQPHLGEQSYYVLDKKHGQLRQKLSSTRNCIDRERRRRENLKRQVQELRQGIKSRRAVLATAAETRKERQKGHATISENIDNANTQIQLLQAQIICERSRIAEALQQVFPIESVNSKKNFTFTLCGLEIPSLVQCTEKNQDQVGAAYGFLAQLVHLLSLYLNVPLRYPIQAFGSQSFIIDPISTIQGSRTFPLWFKGSLFYRFEYGVFLIHKDVEQLINSQSLDVVDLSQTLANLKNLLLVMSVRGTTK